jgi:hypothetical protein
MTQPPIDYNERAAAAFEAAGFSRTALQPVRQVTLRAATERR